MLDRWLSIIIYSACLGMGIAGLLVFEVMSYQGYVVGQESNPTILDAEIILFITIIIITIIGLRRLFKRR